MQADLVQRVGGRWSILLNEQLQAARRIDCRRCLLHYLCPWVRLVSCLQGIVCGTPRSRSAPLCRRQPCVRRRLPVGALCCGVGGCLMARCSRRPANCRRRQRLRCSSPCTGSPWRRGWGGGGPGAGWRRGSRRLCPAGPGSGLLALSARVSPLPLLPLLPLLLQHLTPSLVDLIQPLVLCLEPREALSALRLFLQPALPLAGDHLLRPLQPRQPPWQLQSMVRSAAGGQELRRGGQVLGGRGMSEGGRGSSNVARRALPSLQCASRPPRPSGACVIAHRHCTHWCRCRALVAGAGTPGSVDGRWRSRSPHWPREPARAPPSWASRAAAQQRRLASAGCRSHSSGGLGRVYAEPSGPTLLCGNLP